MFQTKTLIHVSLLNNMSHIKDKKYKKIKSMLAFLISITCQQLFYYDYPFKKTFTEDQLNKQDSSSDSSEDSPVRSITHGHINTSQQNLNNVLHKELNDVSATLSNKVEQAIDNVSQNTPNNFKEVIIIKKRILTDGKRKVVDLNVRERLIPKAQNEIGEFKIRAVQAVILFLVAGIVFTSIMKIRQMWVKNGYLMKSMNGSKGDVKI